jgi:hypothetical protein
VGRCRLHSLPRHQAGLGYNCPVMQAKIEALLRDYESGSLTRRALIQSLTAVAATAQVSSERAPLLAQSLNHVTLGVADVEKSKAFYQRIFALESLRQDPGNISYLGVGSQSFLCLMKAQSLGFDHLCIGIPNYNADSAAKKLQEYGLSPEIDRGQVYFRDLDGVKVQLDAADYRPR